MRTNEERIIRLHSRAVQIGREQEKRRFAAVCASAAVICFSLLAGMAILFPRFSDSSFNGVPADSMNASIFAGSRALGFIVIAILAFLLGISVTVFCFRLKNYQDQKEREDFR